ncbi:hypothetical protein [Mesorhizobium sp.]|jgi:hypothetical protein|uniref:hypothetical protein n=1 Tax=Mesorhizobium sp. TaxID=1871066 RepID=UPI0025F097E1|nr:hypothetical protein [Mesorhizobium sp.]
MPNSVRIVSFVAILGRCGWCARRGDTKETFSRQIGKSAQHPCVIGDARNEEISGDATLAKNR